MPDLDWYLVREKRQLPKALAAFAQFAFRWWGPGPAQKAMAQRASELAALPDAVFKGRPLKTVVCCRCKKPKNFWPSQLWVVIDLAHVACPWCLVRG